MFILSKFNILDQTDKFKEQTDKFNEHLLKKLHY